MKKQYHYFYKITNLINNHFYYGVHNTNNINDGYMGSGKRLHYAYEKYGIENFEKEILKYFDTAKDAFEYEAEYVIEDLVKDPNCYNLVNGGKTGTLGMVVVKDKNNNRFVVFKDDPRYLSGELVQYSKGINRTDMIGKIWVKDKNNEYYLIDKNDPQYISGELIPATKNKVLVKDKNNNNMIVDKNDERIISGELTLFWVGRHHTKETIEKLKENHQKYHYQVGEKNSMYGKRWVNNGKQCLLINKEQLDEYINNGWIHGKKLKINTNYERKKRDQTGCKNPAYGTCWIRNNEKSIKIKKDQLDDYISNGWIKGRKINF